MSYPSLEGNPKIPDQIYINIQNPVVVERVFFEGLTLENCDLENCDYIQLQYLAKKNNIKANLRKVDLRKVLKNIRDGVEIDPEYRPKS